MPVDQYELSYVRESLESLSKRVEAIEQARLDELKARNERAWKDHEWFMWGFMAFVWLGIVVLVTVRITAAVVGD